MPLNIPFDWLSDDDKIIEIAKRRFKACEDWEAIARRNFEYDYKFANGDSINMFQWDSWVVGDRITNDRPCLTINKTMQHCLQIINDGKQNKPGVNIRPVGDTASYEAAQIYQEVVRHIEYLSNAENIYDKASEFQVIGGIGYWRVTTEYLDDSGDDPMSMFAQDILVKPVKDPRSVYLDPDINEVDGSDANFGFIFSDEPKDLYEAKYPKYKDAGGSAVFNNTADGWFTQNHVRVAEYYTKINEEDTYIWFLTPENQEPIAGFMSELRKREDWEEISELYKSIKKRESNLPTKDRTWRERKVIRGNIKCYKIAGNTIIDRYDWLGKYIPIVRVIGRETVIDGILDRIGHTRALLDPQRIYNVNSSANVEFGALQTKSPVVASGDAVEGYEEYYKTANTVNHAWIPYNAYDEEGRQLPPPQRMAAPQSSPAYVQQMQIAQNEMMMVSGQYQAQMGENENAKSGIAINQRQRQGDRATYHFVDGLAIATRYTGKILIDLIPKVYDTKRVMEIEAKDGTVMKLTIDPNFEGGYAKQVPDQNQDPSLPNLPVEVIFNPSVGKFAVQSDNGPSFATRRQEAFNALTQIAAQNKEFMNVAGDILWKVADFPEAQVLAARWRRIIPPNVTGDAPNPQMTEAMQQAAQKIEQQLSIIASQTKDLADKERELDRKDRELELKEKEVSVTQQRLDYEAENKRLAALGNSGPAVTPEQIQPVLKQLLKEMLASGNISVDDLVAGLDQIDKAPVPEPQMNGSGVDNAAVQ
jgi:hypothetical protein